MTYNEFIESESGIKDALDNLFRLTVGENHLELKSVKVIPPSRSYNECMILQEEYSYEVELLAWYYDGPDKGQEFSTTIRVPKMCERGFLINGPTDMKLKWRAPVNYGELSQCIGSRGKKGSDRYIFISKVCTIYPDSGKNVIPRIELNEYVEGEEYVKTYNLHSFLVDGGAKNVEYLIGGPYESPESHYIEKFEKIRIPDELVKRLKLKFTQLTGIMSDIDDNDPYITINTIIELIKTQATKSDIFEALSPVDVKFNSFHTNLFKNDLYKTNRSIKRDLSTRLSRDGILDGAILSRVINKTFNMLGDENAVQAGSLSNALSFISQTNKVYFRNYRKQRKLLHYTDDFYGVICPAKTPEGVGLCGIKNELSSSVVIDDDEVIIKVLDKDGNPKNLSYYDYYYSKILLHESFNYESMKVNPDKFGKLRILQFGKFKKVPNSPNSYDYIMSSPEAALSYNGGLTPFMNRCDGTRLAMSTAMTDQAIPINGGRKSVITTKLAKEIYKKSDLNWKSDEDCVVEDIYGGYIKIRTASGKVKILSIPKAIESSYHSCNLFRPAVKVGDGVKKGDILFESNSFVQKDLALTVPLKVAFINLSTKSDEDAFVISDRAANLLSHSIEKEIIIDVPKNTKYIFDKERILQKIEVVKDSNKLGYDRVANSTNSKRLNEFGLPEPGNIYYTGDLIAICMHEASEGDPRRELASVAEISGDELDFYESQFLPVPYGIDKCKIESVRVLFSPESKTRPEFRNLIEYYEKLESNRLDELKERFGDYEILDDTKSLTDFYNYDIRIVIKISAENNVKIGDKIANRYGGKGTISAILPLDEMPRIGGENGTKVDICVPPKSVINRKNFSQIYEGNLADLSNVAWKLNSEYIKNKEFDKVRESLNKLYVTNAFSEYSDDDLIKYHNEFVDYYTIEVEAIDSKYTIEVMKDLNKFFNYNIDGDIICIPKPDAYVYQTVRGSHGTIEFQRLHFLPEFKAKATSSLGYHDELVLGVGSSRDGGQRLGQMEVWALIAYDTLKEFYQLQDRSDSPTDLNYTKNSINTQMLLIGLLQKNIAK